MNIIVLLKSVISNQSRLEIDPILNNISKKDVEYTTNESDTYALEEALQIKEKNSGHVTAISMGDESAKQTIKDALSKGADKGIHIISSEAQNICSLTKAKIIANILKKHDFNLVLSGLQSNDSGNGQLGVLIAEMLNINHASLVMETNITSNEKIRVKKELEEGWFQWAEMHLPSSLTIQSGINQPRYASLKGIMMMKKKPIEEINLSEDELSLETKIDQMMIPEKSKETEMLDGTSEEIALGFYKQLKEIGAL